jgi:hypothetical protein
MGHADHFDAGEGRADTVANMTEERGVDRAHNRDSLSSEAMTEMLRDLQDAMLALDERLGALESWKVIASEDTRKLAQGVADLGGALSRRVRALEQGGGDRAPILAQSLALVPAPRKPAGKPHRNWVAWIVGLGFITIVALAALWLLRAESLDRTTVTAPPKSASPAPSPPPTVDEPATSASPPVRPQPPPRKAAATQRSTSAHHSSADTLPKSGPTAQATGFARYGPNPPAATQPPPTPPS